MGLLLEEIVAPWVQLDELETFRRGLLQCSGRGKAWGW